MKYIDGYRITVYDKNRRFDRSVFLKDYSATVDFVNDFIFDGFVVLCEEERILVPDLSDDFVASKSMGVDTHCYCRDYLANNEVKDGMLSSNGRNTDR